MIDIENDRAFFDVPDSFGLEATTMTIQFPRTIIDAQYKFTETAPPIADTQRVERRPQQLDGRRAASSHASDGATWAIRERPERDGARRFVQHQQMPRATSPSPSSPTTTATGSTHVSHGCLSKPRLMPS